MLLTNKRRAQYGMALLETLGALALLSTLMAGLFALVSASMGETRAQQAAQHQQQVAAAAVKYMAANHTALLGMTAGGTPAAVTVSQMKAGGFLPDGFSPTNAFGQAPCLLVRQAVPGQLDALVAAHGGTPIPPRDLAQAALESGQGGGYIAGGQPGVARGAAWELPTTGYRNVPCGAGGLVLTGDAAHDGGRLVSNLAYDAPWRQTGDFLRRDTVAGQPELNRMHTAIHLVPGSGAQATEGDTSDPRCTVADGPGKVAIDAAGRLLSCQEGIWRRQGYQAWREPVAAYANLPASGNAAGDMRMVSALNRAFVWDGTAWQAVGAGADGTMSVPGTVRANAVNLRQVANHNAACAEPGTLARDARGLVLSCQSGRWRNPVEFRLSSVVFDQEWTVRVADGTPLDEYVDLTALPGPRPLYITGFALCHATGFPRAYAYINMIEEGGPGYIAGGCLSRPDSSVAGVMNKGSFGLQEIPDNVTQLLLHREVEQGAGPDDYIRLAVKIYSSE